jgi:hypothetical protein
MTSTIVGWGRRLVMDDPCPGKPPSKQAIRWLWIAPE